MNTPPAAALIQICPSCGDSFQLESALAYVIADYIQKYGCGRCRLDGPAAVTRPSRSAPLVFQSLPLPLRSKRERKP